MLLLDTDIVSFAFKRDSRAQVYERHTAGSLVAISFMTLAELYKWPLERGFSPERREKLEEFIRSMVVLPADSSLAQQWAELMVDLKRKGYAVSFPDSWVAATALRHHLPLVTHNRKHFEHIPGLTLISES